jgi:COP9 signalosome complex subunit 3
MSSDLFNVLFSFQPDDPAVLKSNLDYHKRARQFAQQLLNVSAAHFLKGADTPQDVLEVLNPAVNTIAYAFALQARILAAGDTPKTQKQVPDQLRPGGAVWNKLVLFMETFDPIQIRYIGNEWRRLLEYVERVARVFASPGIAISPIRSAMIRLDPTTGTFTSAHLHFIRLCMETRSYAAALPILDNYIHSLPTTIPNQVLNELDASVPCAEHTNSGDYIHSKSGHSGELSVTDIQEYYLLGAMAYIGLRQWKKAMHFLDHVLVTPTSNVANGLMLEAYRKWVLVSCLAVGSLSHPPRTSNVAAMKQVRAAAKPYEALADAFSTFADGSGSGSRAVQKLKAQINRGGPIWDEDGNTGLVRELLDHQQRVLISGLSWRYSAIPMTDVAEYTGSSVDQIVPYVKKLINEGHLNARIDQLQGPEQLVVLRFFLDPTQGPLAKTEKQQQQALFEQTERNNLLAAHVKSADYRLSLTREYVEHVKRQNKKAANASSEAMETSWDSQPDEDMMADL